MKYIRLSQIAQEQLLSRQGVAYRLASLNIECKIIKGVRYITEKQAEKMKEQFENKRLRNRDKVRPALQFAVLELFLYSDDNTYKTIAESVGTKIHTVKTIIDDYYKNGLSIEVQSKMNFF